MLSSKDTAGIRQCHSSHSTTSTPFILLLSWSLGTCELHSRLWLYSGIWQQLPQVPRGERGENSLEFPAAIFDSSQETQGAPLLPAVPAFRGRREHRNFQLSSFSFSSSGRANLLLTDEPKWSRRGCALRKRSGSTVRREVSQQFLEDPAAQCSLNFWSTRFLLQAVQSSCCTKPDTEEKLER